MVVVGGGCCRLRRKRIEKRRWRRRWLLLSTEDEAVAMAESERETERWWWSAVVVVDSIASVKTAEDHHSQIRKIFLSSSTSTVNRRPDLTSTSTSAAVPYPPSLSSSLSIVVRRLSPDPAIAGTHRQPPLSSRPSPDLQPPLHLNLHNHPAVVNSLFPDCNSPLGSQISLSRRPSPPTVGYLLLSSSPMLSVPRFAHESPSVFQISLSLPPTPTTTQSH